MDGARLLLMRCVPCYLERRALLLLMWRLFSFNTVRLLGPQAPGHRPWSKGEAQGLRAGRVLTDPTQSRLSLGHNDIDHNYMGRATKRPHVWV